MKKAISLLTILVLLLTMITSFAAPAYAQEEAAEWESTNDELNFENVSESSDVDLPTASSTLTISEPAKWDHILRSDTNYVKWNAVSGAAGYRVNVVYQRDANGNVLTPYDNGNVLTPSRNVWVGSKTSYNLSDVIENIPEEACPVYIKIWVAAMASSTEGDYLPGSGTSDVVEYVLVTDIPKYTNNGHSNVTSNSATLSLNILKNFGTSIVDAGFKIGTSSTRSKATSYSFDVWGSGVVNNGTMTMTVTGLKPNTKYYYWAYAENGEGTRIDAKSSYNTFTTGSDTGSLTLSDDYASFSWSSTSEDYITVSTSSFSYEVKYPSSAVNSGYDYEWLTVSQSGKKLYFKPNRKNYSASARSVEITVTSNGSSAVLTVEQAKCGESAPTLKVKRGSTVFKDGDDVGTFTLPQSQMEFSLESSHIRRIFAQLETAGGTLISSKTLTSGFSNISFDISSLSAGNYMVNFFASNSDYTDDYYAQRPFSKLTVYFTLTGGTIAEGKGTADDVIAKAEEKLGENGSHFGWNVSWCGYFVGWAGREANAYFPPTNADCANGRVMSAWFVNNGAGTFNYLRDENYSNLISQETVSDAGKKLCYKVTKSSFVPQRGDIIIFLWSNHDKGINWSHVGLVKSYDSSKGIIYTIEGNTDGGIVANRERSYNSEVVAFIRPNYKSADSSTDGPHFGTPPTLDMRVKGELVDGYYNFLPGDDVYLGVTANYSDHYCIFTGNDYLLCYSLNGELHDYVTFVEKNSKCPVSVTKSYTNGTENQLHLKLDKNIKPGVYTISCKVTDGVFNGYDGTISGTADYKMVTETVKIRVLDNSTSSDETISSFAQVDHGKDYASASKVPYSLNYSATSSDWTKVGTTVYVQQKWSSGNNYFDYDIWETNKTGLCTRASASSAFSYLGIKALPCKIGSTMHPYINYAKNQNCTTICNNKNCENRDNPGVEITLDEFVKMYNNYARDTIGQYSPVIIHTKYYNGSSVSRHSLLVIGHSSKSDENDVFYVLNAGSGTPVGRIRLVEMNGKIRVKAYASGDGSWSSARYNTSYATICCWQYVANKPSVTMEDGNLRVDRSKERGSTFTIPSPSDVFSSYEVACEGETAELNASSTKGEFYCWTGTNGEIYYPGDTYTYDQDLHLTAQWSTLSGDKKDTYTITYNANGGKNAPKSQRKDEGWNITLTTNVPVCDGYTFKGWATSKSSSTVKYSPGDTYKSDKDITLYAIWEEIIVDSDPDEPDEPDVIRGDVNGDSEVDISDAIRLIRYLADDSVEVVESALDINGDGEVDISDAIRLIRYLADDSVEIY